MSDGPMDVVFYLLILVFPVAALVARRLPIGAVVKMTVAWLALFGVLLILVGQRDRFRPLFDGATRALPGNDRTVAGGTVRIAMARDGHFWVNVRINGVAARMLVDSGATTTALTATTARQARVPIEPNGFGTALDTANGRLVAMPATVATLQLGSIQARELPVVVAREFGETDVLGMNFLSRLQAWQVAGNTLTLQAEPYTHPPS